MESKKNQTDGNACFFRLSCQMKMEQREMVFVEMGLKKWEVWILCMESVPQCKG